MGHEAGSLPAGRFSAWLEHMRETLRTQRDAVVPCGSCTACCTSSQFILIEPDEHETLAQIPAALQFAAPGLPAGNVVLGYDEQGHCPMFVDGGCSIYEHRPRTCRTYDCRIFAAAGLAFADGELPRIAEQAGRWRFAYVSEAEREEHEALQAKAAWMQEQTGLATAGTTHLAVAVVGEGGKPPVQSD